MLNYLPGADVNTAIPIYYNQVFSDLGDSNTAPLRVFSVTIVKGQQISVTLSIANTAPAAVSTGGALGAWHHDTSRAARTIAGLGSSRILRTNRT